MQHQTNTNAFSLMRGAVMCVYAVALVFALSTTGLAQEVEKEPAFKTVIAKGVGDGPGRAKARDEAVEDAQRKAVEQGLGLFIKSETLVKNLTLISDTIYKESAGYAQIEEYVSEHYDTATDTYEVTVKARVFLNHLETALEDLYEQLKFTDNPRIIVLLDGTPSLPNPAGVANALTANFVEKGFKVFDIDQVTAVRQKDALRLIRAGKADAATVMLLHDKADVIIDGDVSAEQMKNLPYGIDDETVSMTVTLNAKIIRTDSGQVLTARRGTGIGKGFSKKSALEAAEDNAGSDYLEKEKNLRTLLRAVLDPCKEYTVKVAGCSYTQMTAVDNKLALSRFVRQTYARFEDGYAVITVQFKGNAKMLATHLETAAGIRLKVISVTAMTMMVKPVAK